MSDQDQTDPPPASGARRPTVRRRRPRKGTFEIGKVLGTTLAIWARNALPFSLLALVVFAPYGASLYVLGEVDWGEGASPEWARAGDLVLSPLLGAMLAAPLIGAVFAELRGRRMPFGEAIGSGLARLVPAFGVSIVVALIQGAFTFAGDLIGQPVGALLTFVPMTVVACGLVVAIPAAVVERPGVFGALARSWHLTTGHKARIFVILLLFGLVLGLGVTVLAGIYVAASSSDLGGSEDLPWAVQYVWVAIFSSMSAVFSAVVYHDLRVTVEGVDSEEVAAVFD